MPRQGPAAARSVDERPSGRTGATRIAKSPAGEGCPLSQADQAPARVAEALNALTVPDLKGLAAMIARRDLQKKADLVAALARHLTDGGQLRHEVERLNDNERALLAEAVHAWGGAYDRQRMVAKYRTDPAQGGFGRLGLFLIGGCLPEEMRADLATWLPPPQAARLRVHAELPSVPVEPFFDDARDGLVVRMREAAAHADLPAVLRLCQAGRLRCSEATRRATAASLREIDGALSDGDFYPIVEDPGPVQAFAWPLLLQAGAFAELAGGRLQLTARGLAALDRPVADSLRHLWQRWLKGGLLDEFSRVEAIKGQTAGHGHALTAVPPRRATVAAGLAACPAGSWIAVDDFFRYLVAEGLDPVVARNSWRLYLGDPQYGSLGYEGYDWSMLQGRYTLCLLFEYAATLGMIDVAYSYPHGARDDYAGNWGADDLMYLSRYDGLRYFRLNALGAYVLGQTDTYRAAPAPAPSPLRVLANLDVVATGPRLGAADTLVLDAYAERTGPATWHLERDRMLAAMEAGRSIDELRSFLAARAEGGIPEPVTTLLTGVAERAARLRDRGLVRLIECEDGYLAMLLANDRRLKAQCWQVGERWVAVPLASEATFRKGLRHLGYTLAASGGGMHAPDPEAVALIDVSAATAPAPRRGRGRGKG